MTAILRILVAILFLAAPSGESEQRNQRPPVAQTLRGAPQTVPPLWQGTVIASPARLGAPPLVESRKRPTANGQPETAKPSPAHDASAVTFEGTLSWVSPSYGDRYLALPQPRGTRATVCGPAGCVTRVSTDYGPDQRLNPDRIADLSAADWQRVCGVELRFGLCVGTVTLAGLPATDQGEKP